MSAKNVKSFYKKLANDTNFRCQLQDASSQDEWLKIASSHGYTFTQQDLEDGTNQLLELSDDCEELQELSTLELAGVFGGQVRIQPIYGVVIQPRPPRPIWV
jgi:predicted ribosomally synthesized peptide with nif11-like leader